MALGDSFFRAQHAKLPAHIKAKFPTPTYTPPEVETVEEKEKLTPEEEQEIFKQAMDRRKQKEAASRDYQALEQRLKSSPRTSVGKPGGPIYAEYSDDFKQQLDLKKIQTQQRVALEISQRNSYIP